MTTASPKSTPTDKHSEQLRYWLALWRASGSNARVFRKLHQLCDDPEELFRNATSTSLLAGINENICAQLRSPAWDLVDKDLAWAQQSNHHVVTETDADYPALLREIADPPPVLFVSGNPGVLNRLQLAIVGSRNPTAPGKRTAHEFAHCLGGAGVSITSGLATGIDTASHKGAIQGGGITIAVTGCGPDQVYPASNRDLSQQIADQGALITEFPLETPPLPGHFPQRNRIISGLSLGTLVVEAALRSGSLITARLASEQGREVFAIPGSIHSPLSRGCHNLIRQGAKLVETAQDILEELGPLSDTSEATICQESQVPKTKGLAEEYVQLLEHIDYESTSIDQLVERSGLTAEAVSSMLLILELQEYVLSSPGGLYYKVKKRA